MLSPIPLSIPNTWFSGTLRGASQHTHENTASAWNRKFGRKKKKNAPPKTYMKYR